MPVTVNFWPTVAATMVVVVVVVAAPSTWWTGLSVGLRGAAPHRARHLRYRWSSSLRALRPEQNGDGAEGRHDVAVFFIGRPSWP
jgi:hypothetical protein